MRSFSGVRSAVFKSARSCYSGYHREEVRVLDDVENKQKFTNKVDVGGRYGDEWVYDTDGWTTITYNKLKGKLPKTGW